MQIVTQLAVFLENKPGTLARVCEALGEAGINIHALTTSDTVDHTVLRMVVSDPRKALFLFEERNVLVVETEVLMLDADNRPGVLARVAASLAKARINIDYLYCATSPRTRHGVIIMRVSNPKKALEVLQKDAEVS
ncbi:MAG: ACT domain-containing protein [Verrucomicrobia bacterium]|nr:MAG: ACT domain-containing protein [Verrucomicrobiota bacterium]